MRGQLISLYVSVPSNGALFFGRSNGMHMCVLPAYLLRQSTQLYSAYMRWANCNCFHRLRFAPQTLKVQFFACTQIAYAEREHVWSIFDCSTCADDGLCECILHFRFHSVAFSSPTFRFAARIFFFSHFTYFFFPFRF